MVRFVQRVACRKERSANLFSLQRNWTLPAIAVFEWGITGQQITTNTRRIVPLFSLFPPVRILLPSSFHDFPTPRLPLLAARTWIKKGHRGCRPLDSPVTGDRIVAIKENSMLTIGAF